VNERKSPGAGSKAAAKPAKAPASKAAASKPAKAEAAKAPAAPKAPAPAKAPAPKAPAPAGAAATGADPTAQPEKQSFKRILIGRVKSDKMDKTVVVEVVRSKMDPVYKKYVRVRKSYQAHDEENTCKVGDRVEIIEHRPLSKMKRWKVLSLVERAVQE
jgi:small subunit ribosomal protein S17